MCIDIVEVLFGIAHVQITSFFDSVICPTHNNGGDFCFMFLF